MEKALLSHLEGEQIDLEFIRNVCKVEGLKSTQMRRVIWPLLLGVVSQEGHNEAPLVLCGEHDQIEKDIQRSLFMVQEPARREKKRRMLRKAINKVLTDEESLFYYQGYHDVISVPLLVCQRLNIVIPCVVKMSRAHLRPLLSKDLGEVTALLNSLFPLLSRYDKQLTEFIKKSGVQPYFALPWVLTWFSHSIKDFSHVCRLFDLFLSSPPAMPLYVSVAVLIHTKPLLIASNVPCDFSAVHSFYSKLFADIPSILNDPNAEDEEPRAILLGPIIDTALRMIKKYPPSRLKTVDRTSAFALDHLDLPSHAVGPIIVSQHKPKYNYQYRYLGRAKSTPMSRVVFAVVGVGVLVGALFILSQFISPNSVL